MLLGKVLPEHIRRALTGGIPCAFDIEGFITENLRLQIVYDHFAERDRSKIGFLANGTDPPLVCRNGRQVPVVFPKDTIVIDRYPEHQFAHLERTLIGTGHRTRENTAKIFHPGPDDPYYRLKGIDVKIYV